MRQLIVVDTETTGLHATAAILEIAAINVATGQELRFVPHVSNEALGNASPDAMRINRYYERAVYRDRISQNRTAEKYEELSIMLTGNTFGGCNPTFDAGLVQQVSVDYLYPAPMGAVWHYRLTDLSAYAAGSLKLPPSGLLGLSDVCNALGVVNTDPHTAMGDARATAECFRKLMEHYGIEGAE